MCKMGIKEAVPWIKAEVMIDIICTLAKWFCIVFVPLKVEHLGKEGIIDANGNQDCGQFKMKNNWQSACVRHRTMQRKVLYRMFSIILGYHMWRTWISLEERRLNVSFQKTERRINETNKFSIALHKPGEDLCVWSNLSSYTVLIFGEMHEPKQLVCCAKSSRWRLRWGDNGFHHYWTILACILRSSK